MSKLETFQSIFPKAHTKPMSFFRSKLRKIANSPPSHFP